MLLTVVLEKTLESSLDYREIQPVYPKGNQSWIFIGITDVEAETPILWPPDANNWLIWKAPDAGKDWRQEEKGTTEDEIVGSLTRWTWVWANSENWWWTGKPGVLQYMGSQRVRCDWATELNWWKVGKKKKKKKVKEERENLWNQALLFWKDKQNWYAFSQVHQEKKVYIYIWETEDLTKIRIKRGDMTTKITEIPKIFRILQMVIYQQIGQPGRNGHNSRNILFSKTEWEWNRQY